MAVAQCSLSWLATNYCTTCRSEPVWALLGNGGIYTTMYTMLSRSEEKYHVYHADWQPRHLIPLYLKSKLLDTTLRWFSRLFS